MFKNKLVNIMFIILLTLTLIGVVTVVVIHYLSAEDDPNREPTIDEILTLTHETQEITTNLLSNDYVRIKFNIQVDNKKAYEEIVKRDFQLENIIIREMAGMKASDLTGSEGIEKLEEILKEKINELMQEGSVVQVYTTRWIIQ